MLGTARVQATSIFGDTRASQYRLRSAKYCSCSNVTPKFLPPHLLSPALVLCSIHFSSWLFPPIALFAFIFAAGRVVLHVHRQDSLFRNVCSKLRTLNLSPVFDSSLEACRDRFWPLWAAGSSLQPTQQRRMSLSGFLWCLFKSTCVSLR